MAFGSVAVWIWTEWAAAATALDVGSLMDYTVGN